MAATDDFVLRTVYVDEHIDDALSAHAGTTGKSKADIFRRWLSTGMRAARRGHRPHVEAPTAPLVLKTVRLNPKVDLLLRTEAFDAHVPKNDVLRRYVLAGFELSLGTSP